ncbi:hypothetical protein NKI39_12760 [Mesorhizobium sp. M0664]|uniref:hypothetical protein n=1 Tax=Mesorhizobium sp. M0664 TaxID=2956982 RepID=UPI003339BE58
MLMTQCRRPFLPSVRRRTGKTAFFVAQNLQTAPVPCRAMSSSTGTFLIFPEETAKWWTSRAIAAWLALAVSQVLEQSARRRLMRRKAVDSRRNHEHKIQLQPAETPEITASVEACRTHIAHLLQDLRHAGPSEKIMPLPATGSIA